jgi:hypothetical protein
MGGLFVMKFAAFLCLLSCSIACSAQAQRSDWINKDFFSCKSTQFFSPGMINGKWQGKESVSTPFPLMHFRVIDTRVDTNDPDHFAVWLLLENDMGFRYVTGTWHMPIPGFSGFKYGDLFPAYVDGFEKVPFGWSPKIQEQLHNSEVSIGMNHAQVACSIGLPEHVNDYGHGMVQEVYGGGTLLLYWNSNGRVTDIQTFR